MTRSPATRPIDFRIAELLEKRHGVAHREHLVGLGLSPGNIDDRVRIGRLLPLHQSVYTAGHRMLSKRGRWMAAVLALGPRAVLSHRDAGALHGLCGAGAGDVHVTVPSSNGRAKRKRIRTHRSTTLTSQSITTIDSIPVTSVARTLIDLADTQPRRLAERAVDEAGKLRTLDMAQLGREIEANHGRRGAGVMKRILSEHLIGSSLTRNDLEEAFYACCKNARVPMPEEVNADIVLPDGTHVQGDFTWWTRRLMIEVDGFGTHGTRRGMKRDHVKDRRLRRVGWRVERFTWDEVMLTPRAVEEELPTFFIEGMAA